jgi:hypothetical protein
MRTPYVFPLIIPHVSPRPLSHSSCLPSASLSLLTPLGHSLTPHVSPWLFSHSSSLPSPSLLMSPLSLTPLVSPLPHSSCLPSLSEGMKTPASCMELDAKKPMMLHLIPRPNGTKKGANQQMSITNFHCTVYRSPLQQCN